MPIRTSCPGCGCVLSLPDQLKGRKLRCKKCASIFVIGGAVPANEVDDEALDELEVVESDERVRPQQRDRPGAELPIPRPKRRVRQKQERNNWQRLRRQKWLLVGLAAMAVGGVVITFLFWGNADLDVPWPEVSPLVSRDETVVTLRIARVPDEFTRAVVDEAVVDLLHRTSLGGGALFGGGKGWEVVTVSPIYDVKAFANKIDFGIVRSVKNRIITIVANPVEVPAANADDLTKALFYLTKLRGIRRSEGLQRLLKIAPNERRPEVARLLERMLDEADPSSSSSVVEALGVWGTAESVPLLVKAMAQPNLHYHAVMALGKLKEPAAIEPLAQCLENSNDRSIAAKALQSIGPSAERAVLARALSKDQWTRRAVCEVLKEIGTKESLPALEKMATEKDLFVSQPAKDAIQAIQKR